MKKQVRVFAVVLPVFALIGLFSATGCALLHSTPSARQLSIERNWVRKTLKGEHLSYKGVHLMTPVVLEKLVIQGNAIDGIVAYDRQGGHQRWRLDIENGVPGGATVSGDTVFFGASNGQFYAVDVNSGKVRWTFPVRAETLAPPTISDGVVYFQSGSDIVYALDAESGKQLWLYNRQSASILSIRSTTKPVVEGANLYVGFSDGHLVSLNKRDGTLHWERRLGLSRRFNDVDSTPVFDEKHIYVASFDGSLYALEKESGELVWQFDEGGYSAVTLSGDVLYFSTSTGKVVALQRNSGKPIWTLSVKNGVATQPSLYKGYLLYGESAGALVVVNASNGTFVSQYQPGWGLMARPFVDPKTGDVYFMSNDANLFAMKLGWIRPSETLPWQK